MWRFPGTFQQHKRSSVSSGRLIANSIVQEGRTKIMAAYAKKLGRDQRSGEALQRDQRMFVWRTSYTGSMWLGPQLVTSSVTWGKVLKAVLMCTVRRSFSPDQWLDSRTFVSSVMWGKSKREGEGKLAYEKFRNPFWPQDLGNSETLKEGRD